MEWLPTPVFLTREFHGQRSLVGCSPWGYKESNMTEQLTLSLLFAKQFIYILLYLIGPQPFEMGFISELYHFVSKVLNSAWYIVGTQNLLNQIKFRNQECTADLKRKHLQILTSAGSKTTTGAVTLFIFAAFWIISSASLNLLWDNSHRGDSGINLKFILDVL